MVLHALVTVTLLSPGLKDYRRHRLVSGCRGVTLIELLMAVAIVGVLASIAVPALLSARRHANQTSAVASLRAIAAAEEAFATTCANGFFASRLSQLADPPAPRQEAFLSPDLAASRSGHQERLPVPPGRRKRRASGLIGFLQRRGRRRAHLVVRGHRLP